MNTYQAKIGFARTSTTDQNLDTQISALEAAGCGMVRTEQKSGASLEGRASGGHRTTRGHVPKIDMQAIQERLADGLSPTEIARTMKISRGTVYKAKAMM